MNDAELSSTLIAKLKKFRVPDAFGWVGVLVPRMSFERPASVITSGGSPQRQRSTGASSASSPNRQGGSPASSQQLHYDINLSHLAIPDSVGCAVLETLQAAVTKNPAGGANSSSPGRRRSTPSRTWDVQDEATTDARGASSQQFLVTLRLTGNLLTGAICPCVVALLSCTNKVRTLDLTDNKLSPDAVTTLTNVVHSLAIRPNLFVDSISIGRARRGGGGGAAASVDASGAAAGDISNVSAISAVGDASQYQNHTHGGGGGGGAPVMDLSAMKAQARSAMLHNNNSSGGGSSGGGFNSNRSHHQQRHAHFEHLPADMVVRIGGQSVSFGDSSAQQQQQSQRSAAHDSIVDIAPPPSALMQPAARDDDGPPGVIAAQTARYYQQQSHPHNVHQQYQQNQNNPFVVHHPGAPAAAASSHRRYTPLPVRGEGSPPRHHPHVVPDDDLPPPVAASEEHQSSPNSQIASTRQPSPEYPPRPAPAQRPPLPRNESPPNAVVSIERIDAIRNLSNNHSNHSNNNNDDDFDNEDLDTSTSIIVPAPSASERRRRQQQHEAAEAEEARRQHLRHQQQKMIRTMIPDMVSVNAVLDGGTGNYHNNNSHNQSNVSINSSSSKRPAQQQANTFADVLDFLDLTIGMPTTGGNENGSDAAAEEEEEHHRQRFWLRAQTVSAFTESVRGGMFHHLTLLELTKLRLCELPPYLPESLVRLDVSRNEITSLKGIDDSCPFLEVLNARRNRITAIGGATFAHCVRLTHLFLGRNRIPFVEGLAHLEGLETLDMSYNSISTDADIRPLSANSDKALKHLVLEGNPLHSRLIRRAGAGAGDAGSRYKLLVRNFCPNLLSLDNALLPQSARIVQQQQQKQQYRDPFPRKIRAEELFNRDSSSSSSHHHQPQQSNNVRRSHSSSRGGAAASTSRPQSRSSSVASSSAVRGGRGGQQASGPGGFSDSRLDTAPRSWSASRHRAAATNASSSIAGGSTNTSRPRGGGGGQSDSGMSDSQLDTAPRSWSASRHRAQLNQTPHRQHPHQQEQPQQEHDPRSDSQLDTAPRSWSASRHRAQLNNAPPPSSSSSSPPQQQQQHKHDSPSKRSSSNRRATAAADAVPPVAEEVDRETLRRIFLRFEPARISEIDSIIARRRPGDGGTFSAAGGGGAASSSSSGVVSPARRYENAMQSVWKHLSTKYQFNALHTRKQVVREILQHDESPGRAPTPTVVSDSQLDTAPRSWSASRHRAANSNNNNNTGANSRATSATGRSTPNAPHHQLQNQNQSGSSRPSQNRYSAPPTPSLSAQQQQHMTAPHESRRISPTRWHQRTPGGREEKRNISPPRMGKGFDAAVAGGGAAASSASYLSPRSASSHRSSSSAAASPASALEISRLTNMSRNSSNHNNNSRATNSPNRSRNSNNNNNNNSSMISSSNNSSSSPSYVEATDSTIPAEIRKFSQQLSDDLDSASVALRTYILVLGSMSPASGEGKRVIGVVKRSGLLMDTVLPKRLVRYFHWSEEELNVPPNSAEDTSICDSIASGDLSGVSSVGAELRQKLLRQIHRLNDAKTCLRYITSLAEEGPRQEALLKVFIKRVGQSLSAQ